MSLLTRSEMRPVGVAISSILGAFVGAGAGLGVGILGAIVGGYAEQGLDTAVVSFEMGTLAVPLVCAMGGLLAGTLGAWSGTWGRGLLIGVVTASVLCGWWLVQAWSFPAGVKVWSVAVWVIAGGTAGAVGGVLCQRRGRNPQA
jgi:hypothetical protein